MNAKPTDIFILGPGRIGHSLCLLFERAGLRVIGMWGRREASLKRAEPLVACPVFHGPMPGRIADAGVVIITTVDGAIEEVSGRLGGSGLVDGDTVVYHCSGAFDSRILHAARSAGAATGSIHPLQAVPSVEAGLEALPSSFFLLEGDERAVRLAGRLVARIGGKPLELSAGDRALYHAAASVASNYLVTLLWSAAKMMAESSLNEEEATRAFLPMVKNIIARLGEVGSRESLTGPIARGDCHTLLVQLEAIGKRCPENLPLFVALASSTIDLVREIGRVDEETIEEMRELLERFG
jgi:predicted short-subunit dehydrogenase-like oxidoreductase (DUF2520 family)